MVTGLFFALLIFDYSIADATSEGLRVTAIDKGANLLVKDAAPKTASVGDLLSERDEIITPADSHVGLNFDDHAIARLGGNAALRLDSKNVVELLHGTLLLQFPGRTKGKVHAGAVSIVVGGATALLQYQPTVFKFLVLEGTARLYRPGKLGDSILVHPGEMVFGNTTAPLTDPVNFDIQRFVETCPLIQNFESLPNERLITAATERQQEAKSKKKLLDTNLVIFRGSSLVSVVDPAAGNNEVTPEAARGNASRPTQTVPSPEVRP